MAMAASPSTALLFLLAAALLVSSCYGSSPLPPHAISGGETRKTVGVVLAETNPAQCETMVPCSEDKCTEYCVRIGLGNERGFCSFHDMHFECCCPVPPPRRTRRLSSSAGRQAGSV